ncbi:MAG TPA: hypothetical protein VFF69_07675 [Phycisphaerales bacterium]|nr:hypothetical protein [Phycisphaerales bacterium]
MPRRLFEYYQRKRVININANIVASGLLAIVIAKHPVHLVGEAIGADRKILVTLAAGAIDMFVDVAIYYALHWIANHWHPRWKKSAKRAHKRSFFHDASLIQFERAILSPLYYLVAMGLMYALQRWALIEDHSWAFVIGFVTGIVVTRVVHTIWGLRSGRFADLPLFEEPGREPKTEEKG